MTKQGHFVRTNATFHISHERNPCPNLPPQAFFPRHNRRMPLCPGSLNSAWHWSNKGGSLHFWCITPNLTSFYCQSPVKSCQKLSLRMYFPDLLCPTRWILCSDACWSIRSSSQWSHNRSLISVWNMSLTKCDKGDKAKLALSLCCQLCCQLWHGN